MKYVHIFVHNMCIFLKKLILLVKNLFVKDVYFYIHLISFSNNYLLLLYAFILLINYLCLYEIKSSKPKGLSPTRKPTTFNFIFGSVHIFYENEKYPSNLSTISFNGGNSSAFRFYTLVFYISTQTKSLFKCSLIKIPIGLD